MGTFTYYEIDEQAAKRAKEMNSFSDYRMGSATESYRQSVNHAEAVAKKQKAKVDVCFHEKIDVLVDVYAKRLAENLNARFRIDARVPSILIAGGSNFPTRQKEKQNAARDQNMAEWKEIEGILHKIKNTGMGGISADRPDAIQQLEGKLKRCEELQKKMRDVNAYYRKHHTLGGCELLTREENHVLSEALKTAWNPKPYPSYLLSNNSAEIRRLKSRLAELKENQEVGFSGWKFAGEEAVANKEYNRLQLFFEEKPSPEERSMLRKSGFKWAPSTEAVEPDCHFYGGESSIYTAVEWKETDGTTAKGRSGEKRSKAGTKFMTVPRSAGGLFFRKGR